VGTTLATLVCAGLLWAASDWWGGDFSPTLLELLAFGSLISATDTVSVIAVLQQKRVDPHLFYLVFGESALNDAVALVLFNTFAGFLRNPEPTDHWKAGVGFLLDFGRQAVGSPALGIAFGALSALVFKTLNLRKAEFRMLELSLFLICMYLPFMIAECLSLSGIVTIFFAGLSVRRYTAPNVSTETQKVGETIFGLSSFLAETCIFIELGLSIFGFSGSFHWRFCLFALGACLVGRAMAIYPLSYAHNVSLREFPSESDLPTVAISPSDVSSVDGSAGANSGNGSPLRKNQKKKGRRRTPVKRKDKKISVPMAHVLWFAGLRGAVAYACVRDFPDTNGHADEFVAATMFIILFTVVIMGGGTEYLLEYLGIDMGVDEDAYMFQWRKERELKGTFHHLGTWGEDTGLLFFLFADMLVFFLLLPL
jgi:sodium/hydrogen exchanger 8